MNRIIFTVSLFFAMNTFAQNVPTPAPKQEAPIVLINAKIFTAVSEVDGYLVFDQGKIIAVEAGDFTDRIDGAEIIDCKGKHVYPGIIAANSTIGLIEVEALRQTVDSDEVGKYNPNLRALIAYNTDSRVTPTLRSNGVLMAQIVPQGGRISGTASVVQLDAWNYEDANYEPDNALYMSWPTSVRYTGWWAEPGSFERVDFYQNEVDDLKSYFQEAYAYANQVDAEHNIRFEAMKEVFSGEKKLFIRADFAKDIIAAVTFAKEYDITPVIVGGMESHTILDFLIEHNVPIILKSIHRTPVNEDEAVHLPFELPSILAEAGIPFAISHTDYWQVRNLPFIAGTAIAHGLSPMQGLQSITLNVAKIVGIDDRVGSLEVGKEATLIVTEGDLFDMRSSNVTHAFIEGRAIDLGNKQKDLYKKFGTKYEQEIVLPE